MYYFSGDLRRRKLKCGQSADFEYGNRAYLYYGYQNFVQSLLVIEETAEKILEGREPLYYFRGVL